MKKHLLIILTLSLITQFGSSQFIDNYGINIGASYSNQLWDYKLVSIENPGDNYKTGLLVFLSAEKKINDIFSVRPEIGYVQKGFKNDLVLTFADGTYAGINNDNLVINDIAGNIGLKITPLNLKWTPYALLGLRGDYMFSYKDVVIVEENSGIEFEMYKHQVEEFNKFNLGGLIGIGLDIDDLIYLEFEYNPSITNSFNDPGLEIKDNCWGVKLGVNINHLLTN